MRGVVNRSIIMVPYVSLVIAEVDAQHGHGTYDGYERLNRVTVDDRLELFVIFTCKTAFVNDSGSATTLPCYGSPSPLRPT